jgi:hypothetical protein
MAFSDISPLGIPYEILIPLVVIGVAVVWYFFRANVEGMPVKVNWVTETGITFLFKAKEDLRGVFLDIMKGGRSIEQIKKFGIPLDVSEVNEKDSKAYLVKFADDTKKVYVTVRQSRLKHYRLYTVIEGTGMTVDYRNMAQTLLRPEYIPKLEEARRVLLDASATQEQKDVAAAQVLEVVTKSREGAKDSGTTLLLHEESSGFKRVLKDLEEGGRTFMDVILGWIPGIGIGMALTFILLLLLGRLH